MANKVIKMKNDAEYYYKRGIDKSDAGSYIEAIDCFYSALYRDPDNLWIYSELAFNYLELGLVNDAIKVYYKILALDKRCEVGYLGLIQCFLRENRIANAVYYFEMGRDNNALDTEIDFDGFEKDYGDDEIQSSKPKLKVVDRNDHSEMVKLAQRMILSGEEDFARQMLEGIPESSNQITDAKNHLSFLAYIIEDYERCARLTKEVLDKEPNNIYALSTAALASNKVHDSDKVAEYSDRLDSVNSNAREDIYRIAMCFLQLGDTVMCEKYFGKLFDMMPYERDITLAYSIALYDNGKRSEAKSFMLDLRRLFPEDSAVSYYARFIGEGQIKHIPVATDLPEGEKERRLHRIDETFAMDNDVDKVVERMYHDEELYDMVLWLFASNELAAANRIAAFLIQHEDWQVFFKDKLIDPDVPVMHKKEYLLGYLRYSDNKKFSLVIGDLLQHFNPRPPKCNDTFIMRDTYWTVYATCAFVTRDFSGKIGKAYKKVIDIMSAPAFEPFNIDKNIMAAVIVYLARPHKIFFDKTECCEIFGCAEESFDEYLSKLKLKVLPSKSQEEDKPEFFKKLDACLKAAREAKENDEIAVTDTDFTEDDKNDD